MGSVVTTFPRRSEFQKARARLEALSLPYEVLSPDPGYARVGAPAIVLGTDARMTLLGESGDGFTCCGWVDHRPRAAAVPGDLPPAFAEDVFGEAAIMVLAPCVAEADKARVIAHLSGDLTEAFPYLNAEMPRASYNAGRPTFSFVDGGRMIAAYPRRIAVAKVEDILDAWRTLEALRCRVNDVWARRSRITPVHEMRQPPPALEIYKRLPRTNCGACGETTCLGFALSVRAGRVSLRRCRPVFEGPYDHLRGPLLEACAAIGEEP